MKDNLFDKKEIYVNDLSLDRYLHKIIIDGYKLDREQKINYDNKISYFYFYIKKSFLFKKEIIVINSNNNNNRFIVFEKKIFPFKIELKRRKLLKLVSVINSIINNLKFYR